MLFLEDGTKVKNGKVRMVPITARKRENAKGRQTL
jgi:hypothetical protein